MENRVIEEWLPGRIRARQGRENIIAFPLGFRYTTHKFFRAMDTPEDSHDRLVASNRKARHEYHILETFEAGIVLKGTEVKSLRLGNATITEGYALLKNGEMWLMGMHISPYQQGSYANVDPVRTRKLLLHKNEILKLVGKLQEKGLTLVPLKVYFKKNHAKVLLGLAKGKKAYDKRHDIAKRDVERAIRQRYAR
jgi:SsrA-binding protein